MAAPALTARGYVTLDEYYALTDLPDDCRVELVDGEIVVTPAANPGHAQVARALFLAMHAHATAHRLGEVFGDGFGYDLPIPTRPDTQRIPDVSFVRAARVPRPRVSRRCWRLAPDVAAEVRSPSNTPSKMNRKVTDFLEGGTQAVWLVDWEARTVEVRASGAPSRLLREADTLDGGDAFPGFALPLAELFAVLDD